MSRQHLESCFPYLASEGYRITSPATTSHNCIAYAAGDTNKSWWPHKYYFWPDGAPFEETVDAFMQAFATLGYEPCATGDVEGGFEKIAIYVDHTGTPTHAARQLTSGKWKSKCGDFEDIEHDTLDALNGFHPRGYGTVARFMRRPK